MSFVQQSREICSFFDPGILFKYMMRVPCSLLLLLCLFRPGFTQEQSRIKDFLSDNFTFKKEIYLQLTGGYEVDADPPLYSRQSAGFEVLKKFSTSTATLAAFDLQARLVRRDNYLEVLNDMEGMDRPGFSLEYHNVYLDIYNVFNPFLSESGRGRNLGRFNGRIGRFYVPFGINLQTDTHGTLMQLSNDQNFGFDRDWYAGMYGSISRDLNYDCYYLLGSGYSPRFRGQSGLFAARLSLGSRFVNEYGLEGGFSLIRGERYAEPLMAGPSMTAPADAGRIVPTFRVGLDGRYTHLLWKGTAVITTELSGGEDEHGVFSQLHQFDYVSRSRKWGWAGQYRRVRRSGEGARDQADASLIGEISFYSKYDIGGSTLRWIKLNIERQLERREGGLAWLFTVQYYYYW